MRKKGLLFLLLMSLLSALAVCCYFRAQLRMDRIVEYDYQADVESVAQYDSVIRFAGGSDFSPFAYLDENGLPCGRDVELAFALGRVLNRRVEVTLGDWTEMQEGILDGTYDVLITVDYSEERSRIMGYTSPVCLDSYVFFGTEGLQGTDDLTRLKQYRIAALNGGGATDNYLSPLGLLDNTTFYDTQLEAFQSVVDGTNDLAIAGYIYGSNIISSQNLGLCQVGTPLYGSAYYFTYDVHRLGLGTLLNAALATLEANGTMETIEEKWTTHYQPSLTLGEYVAQNRQKVIAISLGALILLCALGEALLLMNRRHEKLILERDSMTGLYHMRSFLNRMKLYLQKHPEMECCLIRFDLDNFRAFNSTQGSERGDALLRSIGEKLISLQNSRNELVLAGYLGSDHFVLLASKTPTQEEAESLYTLLNDILGEISAGYRLSISMGICPLTDTAEDMASYCDRALIALRSVKNDYYRHLAFFDDTIQSRMSEEKLITDRMFSALEQGCFVPFFQPQYDYATGQICGAEALARWREEDGSYLSPADFIPVFEKNGFIYEMDKAIWRGCCRQIRLWKEQGLTPPPISVNISRADIFHRDLIDTLERITSEEGISMAELHLEITESAYMENSSILIETVEGLHRLGAAVEMDDFGSGYSSLAVLKDIFFDTIKLDMSLLKNNSLAGKDAELLSSIIRLGRNIGSELIAEGVEQREQAEYLHSLGCDRMQGYFFSRPLPAEEFEKLLTHKE